MASSPEVIAEVVALNGGQLVGRTRLQKSLYILEAVGLGYGFDFDYYHYGPYSEEASILARDAVALDILTIDWTFLDQIEFATYTSNFTPDNGPQAQRRRDVLAKLKSVDSITLELAATADFLAKNGFESDPWSETARRKPSKATAVRIEKAKALLSSLDLLH